MTRLRAWREEWALRSVATPDGPVTARRGQIIIVAVVDDWEAAAKVVALLNKGSTDENYPH